MNCSYCYVPDRKDAAVMQPDVWQRVLGLTVADRQNVGHTFDFLFHAGEPLAIGLNRMRQYVDACIEVACEGVSYSFSVQTNGTLIDARWADFLRDYDFSVGISIDGPATINDISRLNWAGRSTLNDSLRGIRILSECGHSNFGCLSVVGPEALKRPFEIMEFFDRIGVSSVGFNIEDIDGVNLHTSFGVNREARRNQIRKQYVDPFYEAVFDYWWPIRDRFSVREFADVLRSAARIRRNPDYTREPDIARPLGIITFKRDGCITTFAPEFASAIAPEYNDFVVAHVDQVEHLTQIRNMPWFIKISNDVMKGVQACRESCPYFPVCGSSHVSNRYFEYRDLSRPDTFTCEMMLQAAADVCFKKLTSMSEAELA